ncbi:calmodulin-like 41 [Actinidia rufa]|uniref:Calmodulin-like 41 n=1 Tax=Actinidia rufa TaxID=165716 RepID=A0A7J0EKI2_9ERIC|nr:calmodulin-like 41 [Actinidia rufa]
MAVTTIITKQSKRLFHKTLKLTLPHLLHSKRKNTPSSLLLRKDEFRQVFHYFDTDGNGKLSSDELQAYFESVGESMSSDEARRAIMEFDKDGDEVLVFGEFVELMERGDHEERDEDLRRAFEMFEVEKGCGCITPKGLQQVLKRLGDAKSREECKAMIRAFDLDGNGVLDFNEFNKMMTQVA